MTTVTDLTVDVGMDLASLRQGVAEMTDIIGRAGAQASRSFDGVAGRLDAVGTAFKSLAAAAGVTLSFGFVKSLVADSIEAQASLADLGLKAGISASQISTLIPAARLSGTSLEEVALGAGKFAKTLVEIEAGTSKGAAAFKALGFSAQDAARFLKNPQQGLVEVAQAASKYADDGNKVAAAQLLMGKSAAQLLPFLHDLAEVGADQVLVTDAQAEAAKRLEHEWVLYQLQQEQLRNQVVAEIVPSLITLVRVLDEIAGAAGGSREGIRGLIQSGQIAAWAQEAGANVARFADVLSDGPRILRPYAESVGLLVQGFFTLITVAAAATNSFATGRFVENLDIAKTAIGSFVDGVGHVKQAFKDADAPASTRFFDQFTSSLVDTQLELDKTADATDRGRPSLANFGAAANDASNELQKLQERLQGVLASIEGKEAGFSPEFFKQFDTLTKAFNAGLLSLTRYRELTDKLNSSQPWAKREADAAKALTDSLVKAAEALTMLTEREDDALAQFHLGLSQSRQDLEFQISLIGKTAEEQEKLTAFRKVDLDVQRALAQLSPERLALEADGLRETAALTKQQIAANLGVKDSLLQVQAQLEQQKKAWTDVWSSLADAGANFIDDFVQHGSSAFRNLWDQFKSFAIRTLAQLATQTIIVNLAGNFGGVAGSAATSLFAGNNGVGGLLSNLFGGQGGAGGGLGGLASSFALSGVGAGLGLSAPVTSIAGGLSLGVEAGAAGLAGTASLTAAGSALVAAIPVVGWALAAAAAIYAIVQSNKKPSPVEGQFAFDQATTGFEDNAFTSSRFGNVGFRDEGTKQFSGEAGQVLNKSVAGLLDLFAQRFTDEQIKQTAANLQAINFPHLEGTFTTEDFLKKYGDQILKQVATTAFDVLDPALGKVIDGFQGTGEELTKFIGSLLVFDDLAKKLPADVRESLVSAIGNTQEGLNKVTEFAAAFLRIQDVFNGSLLDDALKVVEAQNQSFATSVELMGENLAGLATDFDGSSVAASNLAQATEAYYQAQVQLLAQLEQVKVGITSLFDDTIRSLTLQTLDNAGKGDFLNSEVTRLQEQLFASSDPQQIQDLAARINSDINDLFGLLTPEEQRAQLGTFTDNIRLLNDEVVQRISDVEAATQDAANGVLTQVQTALAAAIQTMQATADENAAAVGVFSDAVDRMPRDIDVAVTVDDNRAYPAETNG